MSETTFEKARAGDRVWVRMPSFEGWTKITQTRPDSSCPIVVYLPGSGDCSFTYGGQHIPGPNTPQCLFWDKPEIIAPLRPKRLVKKMIEVRLYQLTEKMLGLIVDPSNSDAVDWRAPVQTIEIEVEE